MHIISFCLKLIEQVVKFIKIGHASNIIGDMLNFVQLDYVSH